MCGIQVLKAIEKGNFRWAGYLRKPELEEQKVRRFAILLLLQGVIPSNWDQFFWVEISNVVNLSFDPDETLGTEIWFESAEQDGETTKIKFLCGKESKLEVSVLNPATTRFYTDKEVLRDIFVSLDHSPSNPTSLSESVLSCFHDYEMFGILRVKETAILFISAPKWIRDERVSILRINNVVGMKWWETFDITSIVHYFKVEHRDAGLIMEMGQSYGPGYLFYIGLDSTFELASMQKHEFLSIVFS